MVKCLVDGCDNEATARGLCKRCLAAAAQQVHRKKTSWVELERLGLALPPQDGRGVPGLFSKALAAKRAATRPLSASNRELAS